jgi:hypothetical protein
MKDVSSAHEFADGNQIKTLVQQALEAKLGPQQDEKKVGKRRKQGEKTCDRDFVFRRRRLLQSPKQRLLLKRRWKTRIFLFITSECTPLLITLDNE